MKWRATAASWFSTFFEKAFVNWVNRRMDIRIVRFAKGSDMTDGIFLLKPGIATCDCGTLK